MKYNLACMLRAALVAGVAVSGSACSGTDDLGSTDQDLTDDGESHRWIYAGALPTLSEPELVVSLKAHTLRVTGLAPEGWDERVPYYALVRDSVKHEGRKEITVVYPVATGVDGNNVPGHYPSLLGLPFVRNTEKAHWGGFPFFKYHMGRGFAFHGPITSTEKDNLWRLIRGPISKGCQRMQGEHVVEFAQLVGIDMTVPHKETDKFTLPVDLNVIEDYDSFEGKTVDVDYPAMESVELPTENVHMFPAWDSRDLPEIVCPYDPNRTFGPGYCASAGANLFDPLEGPPEGYHPSVPDLADIDPHLGGN